MAKAAFEHKENTGSIFTNDKKNQDSHPDFTGQVNIAGELYRVAAWDNEYGNGGSRIALKFETEEEFQSRIDQNSGNNKSGGSSRGGSATGRSNQRSTGSRRPSARK